MSCLFDLWNFFCIADNICEFDVTRKNIPRIKDATEEWIKQCLSIFEIQAPVDKWEIQALRSYYFSGYPNEKDWQDRWTESWTVKVFLSENISHLNIFSFQPQHIKLTDETWSYGFKDPCHENTALLISNYEGSLKKVESIAENLIKEASSETQNLPQAQISLRSFGSSYHQMRIIFEEIIFSDYIATLEKILGMCRQQGGIVNWNELI